MSTWDAARIASRRQLPKERKPPAPVGRQIDANRNCMTDEEINRPDSRRVWFAPGECSCCQRCGYHVCSCPPKPEPPRFNINAATLALWKVDVEPKPLTLQTFQDITRKLLQEFDPKP